MMIIIRWLSVRYIVMMLVITLVRSQIIFMIQCPPGGGGEQIMAIASIFLSNLKSRSTPSSALQIIIINLPPVEIVSRQFTTSQPEPVIF